MVFGLSVTSGYGRSVITLSGDVRAANVASLRNALVGVRAHGDRYVDVDMDDVTSLDAACVSCLLEAQVQFEPATLTVVKTSSSAARDLMDLGYLDELT